MAPRLRPYVLAASCCVHVKLAPTKRLVSEHVWWNVSRQAAPRHECVHRPPAAARLYQKRVRADDGFGHARASRRGEARTLAVRSQPARTSP